MGDTQTETLTEENDVLIEEMLQQATEAPEPGGDESRVIHRGDENQPAPMLMSTMISAGWVYIYETKTGERSVANRNNLVMLLKIKNPDGTRRFTTKQPPFAPKMGTTKCLLHADSPMREYYNELGLPVCRKANLRNKFNVTQHMKKRHPVEWETIEQERIEAEKQEERDFRKSLMVGQQVAAPVQPADVAPSFICKKCGREFGTKQGMKLHMRRHK